jgi:urease accessory protein
VADEGLLVVAPDPMVCFAASRYRQQQRFELAPGAALVAIDWMTSGRWAAGERWAFDSYEARLTVRRGDALLVHDVLSLRAEDGDLAVRMGRFEVIAIAVIVNVDAAAALVARMAGAQVEARASQLVAVTALDSRSCVIRVAGLSVEQVGHRLRELLSFVPALLGDDPFSRKW